PVLGKRLLECVQALLNLKGVTAGEIFGDLDDLKLRSCLTLFALAAGPGSVFEQALRKYYRGERDPLTLEILKRTGQLSGTE
ncbi:MAG TPA: DUF1810 family protein, partial [bacterium]|nr:DUF1810 family protein [bacterium]